MCKPYIIPETILQEHHILHKNPYSFEAQSFRFRSSREQSLAPSKLRYFVNSNNRTSISRCRVPKSIINYWKHQHHPMHSLAESCAQETESDHMQQINPAAHEHVIKIK